MIIINPSSASIYREAQRDPLNESIVLTNLIGEYYIFPGGGNIFNYMDYSLSYKKLSGVEIDANNAKSISFCHKEKHVWSL